MPTVNIQSNATSFANLQAGVLRIFKRTDKTTELQEALNETYQEMVAVVDPRKLKDQLYQTCVIKQEDYAIPDTVFRINHPIRLIESGSTNNSSQSYPLRFYPKDEYDYLEPNPNATTIIPGRPWAYTFWKNSILLTEIPDKAYILEMNVGGEPTLMSGDSDATIFSPMWDQTIKAGALARLYAGIGLDDQVSKWMTIYKYGFAGDADKITGGINLLKRVNEDITRAPMIVQPKHF